MNRFRNSFVKTGFILVAVIITFSGCKKDDEPAPQIPPESTFVMDFSAFSNPDDTLANREMATYHNWGYSYANVVIWSTIIKVGLAVPVASFLESFNHEAVYHPAQNNWTWSYNVWVNLAVYEAELTGYLQSDSVVWEMRISRSNGYSDFLWYHGKSAIGQSGGFWILMDNPDNPHDLLRIDWNNANGTADLKYTNIVPGGPENGGYIFYGTSLTGFDRFYDIYNKGADNLTEIEWNSVNFDGRVKDPNHYGNSDWHCWDVTLSDIVCP